MTSNVSEYPLFDGGRAPQVVPLSAMRELIERSKEPCQCCGENAALNPHRICKAKVEALVLLAKARPRGEGWCRCEEGRGLREEDTGEWTKAPYRLSQHAARLLWYGMAERRGNREGVFRATRKGLEFLRGTMHVPARILCCAGVVRYVSTETVCVSDVAGVVLDKPYWDSYPWGDVA